MSFTSPDLIHPFEYDKFIIVLTENADDENSFSLLPLTDILHVVSPPRAIVVSTTSPTASASWRVIVRLSNADFDGSIKKLNTRKWQKGQ